MSKKLGIITTHPIQYNAPWFQLLAQRGNIKIKVFYTWSQVETEEKYDPGFKKNVKWDIPLLEGYDYTFVKNISRKPGSDKYKGIENPTLIPLLEDWCPDAILVFGWKFKSHLSVLRHFEGKIPILFRGDSILKSNIPWWRRVARREILKRVFGHIDKALYVGTQNKRYFQSAGLVDDRLVFVPHAVDNRRFSESDEIPITGWPNKTKDKLIFLFAGKLIPKKDPRILIEALSEFKEKAVLVLVGNGPLEKELKYKYKNVQNITFLGFQNQQSMPSIYKKTDVFVLPSISNTETWGLSVNEAMACGKPVLVSDKCGCAVDLVEPGKNGYVFRAGDRRDLIEKIQLLIDRKTELPKMGAHSFEKIQDWSFDAIAETVEKEVIRSTMDSYHSF